jgi:glycosyltransferase involved in cell wall biosynthesis
MRVIATVRTRNEQANVGRFCDSYASAADEILVADGGSIDNTVVVAYDKPRTSVLFFHEEMDVHGGLKINPQGKHVNFLIRHAVARGADWIIFDDCDCVPNYLLRRDVRTVIETADAEGKLAIYTRRVYMWGNDHHFPDMHKPNTSLWAFKADAGVLADEQDPWHLTMTWRGFSSLHNLRPHSLHLEFPYCLLHFTWQTEKSTQEKLDFYRTSGVQPTAKHPKDFAGKIEPVKPFMKLNAPEVGE